MQRLLSLIFIFLMSVAPAYSAGWYLDTANGLDTNAGTSWALAVKTGQKLTAISNAGTMAAGDTIYVKYGQESLADSLRFYEGGTAALPIVVTCVGDSTLGKFKFRGDKKQTWTDLHNGVWVAYVPDAPADTIKAVWFIDPTYTRYDLSWHRGIIATSPGAVNAQYEYHWKPTVDSLYIYSPLINPADYVTTAYRRWGITGMSGGNADYITVNNVEVCGYAEKNVFVGNTCEHWTFNWCEAHHNGSLTTDGRLSVYFEGAYNTWQYGYIYQAGGNGWESANSYNMLQYTWLRDCHHHCVDTKGNNTIINGIQHGNIIRWNRIWNEEISGTAVNGIYVGYLTNSAWDVKIYGNTLWNIAGNGIIVADDAAHTTGNVIIENNTIVTSAANNIYIDVGDSTIVVRSNLGVNTGGTPYNRQIYLTSFTGKTIDYNDWYTTGTGVWAASASATWDANAWESWIGNGVDTHSVRVNPVFYNAAANDYRPTAAAIASAGHKGGAMVIDAWNMKLNQWKPSTMGAYQIPYTIRYLIF